jgi:DNA topoisomerase-1
MSEKIRYVKAGLAGYNRVRQGSSFSYTTVEGTPITDGEILKRIKGLVLPPAWEDVWICPWENGHLQATGTDAMGRKQYRYHSSWVKARSEHKYERLYHFGEKLPLIRRRIGSDLRKKALDKDKVIAIALRIMEETLIRVGNASYEKRYGSYGLTTLQSKHVKIDGQKALFQFKGKKGVLHKIELKHAALARLLQKVRDIPGQDLFQYYEEGGEHKGIDSGEVNEYLKTCAGDDFTCKDFRTWAGSVQALRLLAEAEPFDSAAECKRNMVTIIEGVAGKLGNTTAVCKKYYIHPQLFLCYEAGTLEPFLRKIRAASQGNGHSAGGGWLHPDEKVFLAFLKKEMA